MEDKNPTRKHPTIIEPMLDEDEYYVREQLLDEEWVEEVLNLDNNRS